MKKSVKNIILSLVVILMFIAIITTITIAKPNIPNDMPQGMGKEIPNDQSMQGKTMEEPPEKPDGEVEEKDKMGDKENMPPENLENMPDMPNMQKNEDNKNKISLKWYIALGIESFLLAVYLMYLILSNLNQKTFKETFATNDKKIIYLLAVIVITVFAVMVEIHFCNNTNNNNFRKNEEKMRVDNANENLDYSAQKEITVDEEITSGEYNSSNVDENAIGISGNVTSNISNVTVSKTGDSSAGDNTSFYGINSAIIARNKANVVLKNIEVTTDAVGANGVFCYGGSATTNNSSSDGTTVDISDSKITTTKDNSGGIMTTGGGKMKATNLKVTTSGISSAAIRTDRGGGDVEVIGGNYTTLGQGSPAVYSTANISIKDANLVAKASEGIVIEGKNSVTLTSSKLTDTNTKLNGKSTTYKNIFLYQSMSGDAAEGVSSFTAKNCEITTNNGDTLYVTNTRAQITLENNSVINNDKNSYFLKVQKDSWGQEGKNGGEVTLNLKNQKAIGNIFVDNISTLDIEILESSYYEGAINSENQAKNITLKLDSSSKIKLTSDTYVDKLDAEDNSYSNIDFNGYKLYVNGEAIN